MIKSIKNIIIFLITIPCVGQETIDDLLYQGDPLEKSAFLKKENPWFARYQIGELTVVGFPGETTDEKKQRMQKWVDAKYGLFIHWGPQRAGGEYEISSEVLNAFNPVMSKPVISK